MERRTSAPEGISTNFVRSDVAIRIAITGVNCGHKVFGLFSSISKGMSVLWLMACLGGASYAHELDAIALLQCYRHAIVLEHLA